ncbi:hypothetical protein FZC66_14440 [Priestia megaterium]|nr:hypothetical protein FZC66_14440 [Priestia megaterium]
MDEQHNPTFGPDIAEQFQWESTLNKEAAAPYIKQRKELCQSLEQLLGEEGLLCLPTAPGVASVKNAKGEALQTRRLQTLQMTCIAGLAGLPQLTIPAGEIDGFLIGLSLIAGVNQDEKLLTWVNQYIPALHSSSN